MRMGIEQRRERERDARRKAVLDATRGLVRQHGFNGTTTRQIAETCELGEGTLFSYFQSKDEIFIALLFEGIDFTAQGLEQIAEEHLPQDRVMARLWQFFVEVRRQHPEYFHIFSYLAHPDSTAAVSDEMKAQIALQSGDNFRRLAGLLQGSMSVREARSVADLLWATFVGLTVLRDSRENLGAPLHPNDRELAAAVDLLRSGIAAS
jgi:AcrR family transcriptional regulator